MSRKYLDGSTLDECIEAMRQGRTLDDLAGLLHMDTELLGRLLQLPLKREPGVAADHSFDLWSTDRLDGQL